MTREEVENLVSRLLDGPIRFAAETSDDAALRRRKTEHDASAALRALMARAEAAEEREEATRAANVDTKLHWDVLKADYDAVCARAEAAEDREATYHTALHSACAEMIRVEKERDEAKARAEAAEAEVRKLRADVKRLTGTLRYIQTQAKSRPSGDALTLSVIERNAAAALDDGFQEAVRAALSLAPDSGENTKDQNNGSRNHS